MLDPLRIGENVKEVLEADLKAIKDGLIEATLVQQTALMPLYGLQILYNLNNVPIPISKDNKKAGVSGAPILIDTSVVVVDRRNCELFMR